MRGQRLYEGIKQARRVLQVWRACQSKRSWERDGALYADNGPIGQVMRFTRVRCSCMGCGNQRKWEGPTLQECRISDEMAAQLAEGGL